jgi:tRNA C32,U32 (ribose-2'-O)-methylase TrmJ
MVLVAPRNPLNIGAAARDVSNFGFFQLRVVNPYEVAFREARSAVGRSPVGIAAMENRMDADSVVRFLCEADTVVADAKALLARLSSERLDIASPISAKRCSAVKMRMAVSRSSRRISTREREDQSIFFTPSLSVCENRPR